EMAENALKVAEFALDAILAFMNANPLAKVVGLGVKEAAVHACKQKLEGAKRNLQDREKALEKRTRDHEQAIVDTKNAEDT
ncbi:unnamed protein product, partial [Rotaria magnacalcarata]